MEESRAGDLSAREGVAGSSRGRFERSRFRTPSPSDGDDDLAARAACSEVTDRLGNLSQRERLVDDAPDRAAFQQRPQLLEILPALLRDEGAKLLTHKRRECRCAELTANAEPLAAVFTADNDKRPARRECSPKFG